MFTYTTTKLDTILFNSKLKALLRDKKRHDVYFKNSPIPDKCMEMIGVIYKNMRETQRMSIETSSLNIIRKLKLKVDRKSLEHMYFSNVGPIIEYADVI